MNPLYIIHPNNPLRDEILKKNEVMQELKKTKSPVRKHKYVQGYDQYVEGQLKIYKLLAENNLL